MNEKKTDKTNTLHIRTKIGSGLMKITCEC